ncbi:DUF6607 family protein [Bdellovibrio sp. HCB209]|uniref:DUF6607 family protein n=1 Tax=Bdellovibrio sp. HCB209 TaxID=3394354 RepID=UPI0039B3E91D
MKKLFMLPLLTLVSFAAHGRDISNEKSNIKSFQGCYEVGFNFVETFPLIEGYKTTAPYHSKALEYVVVDEETNNHVGLQHILIVGKDQKMTLKHWRQEWHYEPTSLLEFKGNNTWQQRALSAEESEGRWLQSVTQVDDAPRYECAAKWVQTGESQFWECTSWNPLPRREYTKRSDYQVIERRNRQMITKDGWIHEQDSQKLRLDGDKVTAFTKERGENTYKRVDDSKCQAAANWWTEHKSGWKVIRASWAKVRAENPKLKLGFKDPEGDLWPKLFAIEETAKNESWPEAKLAKESEAAIRAYVIQ